MTHNFLAKLFPRGTRSFSLVTIAADENTKGSFGYYIRDKPKPWGYGL